jgi:outer membrane protein insertion porin family
VPTPPTRAFRSRSLALLFGLVLVLAPAAQSRAEIAPELVGEPILEVEVAGEAAAIAPAREVGIPLGAPLNRGVVRAAIERLIESGRFTDVQIDAEAMPGGVKLIVWLTARIVLRRLDISGNQSLDTQSVREALGVAATSEVSPEQLDRLARNVAKAYAEHGYLGAQIEVGLRDTDDPSSKVLMVHIEEGVPTRIRQIRFAGEQPLDAVQVRASMSSAVGDILDRTKLNEDVAKAEAFLRRKGFLETELSTPLVTIEGANADVDIPSRIGPRYTLQLRGYEPFSRGELSDLLGIEQERLTNIALQHTFSERLLDFYARRGFSAARVNVLRYRGNKPNTAVLRIQIERGEQLHVVAVSFAGARHFSRDFLRDQLFSFLSEQLPGSTFSATVDSEVVSELHNGQSESRKRTLPAPPSNNPEFVYYEPVYKTAIDHIVELYHGEGYLSARVGPPQLERIGKNRAAVLIPVVEGPRTLLHQVVISGADAISARELLTTAELERDQPFSYLALEQARRRMLDAYHERGYAFAKLEASVRFSSDRTRAKVEFQVVERYPVNIDRIVIEGADRTNDSLIRRVLKLEPGDLFRPSLARASERELGNLGVFNGVSVALQDPELPARVKSVIVTVSERRSQFLGFSAGLSTGQGARSGFEYGYRNLFGDAVGLTLRVQLAYQLFFVDPEVAKRYDKLDVQDRLERRISLGTTIPRLPGFGSVRTSIDLVHLRDNERDFGLDQNAIGVTFSHRPLDRLLLTVGGDLENNDVALFTGGALLDYLRAHPDQPRLLRLLRVPDGASTLIDARSSISYDHRDNPFTPTRGYFTSLSMELARTLTGAADQYDMTSEFKSRYLKVSVSGSGYIPLGGDFVIATQARVGRIIHLTSSSKTYPNRAFFLGGVDTLRGFLEDELIPQDIADQIIKDPALLPNAVVRSGDAFILFRGELRFPIYHELRGGVFSDVGNLWSRAQNFDPLQLRPTAGIGLRLNTPVGPIALDWGFNLQPRGALHERSSAVHFAIGLF